MSNPQIKILDALSVPGNPAKPNDDRFGFNEACAFVIDGATGLGDRQYMDASGSDAAWVAARFADGFRQQITRHTPVSDVARAVSRDARAAFLGTNPDVPRYAWPLSAFSMIHATDDRLTFHGLGDSCVLLLQEDGSVSFHTAIPDAFTQEQAAAASHIARTGGITKAGGALGDTQTLAALRRRREAQNTEGDIWTLGLVPAAADHLVSEELKIEGKAHAIICSDGFADLVVLYEAYDAASLVRAALEKGLAPMIEELRRFERETDPEGLRYPRFKQSDDTTAILVELTA